MDILDYLIKNCIPTVIGALIVIVPTAINKRMEMKQKREEQKFQDKQQRYIQLISLFTKVLRGQNEGIIEKENIEELIKLINTINITENIEVVKALNNYVNTWGKTDKMNQNAAYTLLIKTIRKDLYVKDNNREFPDIGLIEINIKK